MTDQPLDEEIDKSDRRQSQRKNFPVTLEMEWGSALLRGSVRDIGPRGLFVELTPPLWLGATFHARLSLNPVLSLDCTVVRVEPGRGNALTFEVPEESGKAQFDAFYVSLPSE